MPLSSPDSSPSRGNFTCRSILSRKNPDIIDAWDGSIDSKTKLREGVFDNVVFNEEANCTIQEWTDFTYEAINLAYGDLLDHVPTSDRRVNTPTTTPTTIVDENGIDRLGLIWTCNIVRAPLKYSGAVLRRRPAVCPQAEHLETDPVLSSGLEWTHPDLDPTELMPDWTAYDRAMEKSYSSAAEKNPKKPLTFAIGESKMCQCWKSDGIYSGLAGSHIDQYLAPTTDGKLLHKVHDVTEKRIQPLERLATYCRFGETRYGFIITQEELVAIRVRRLDPALISGVLACDKPHAGIEYTSIPWDAFGPGKLTANLAIWALGCMGMNDHHRIMESSGGEPLTSMVRLTKWTHDEKNKVYRNDISGREITEECWKKLGSAAGFVRLDDEDEGASYTRTFTTGGSVSSINQGMRAVALDTISSRGRKAAQEAAQQGKPADQAAGSSSKSEHTDQGAASSNKSISGKIAASEVTIAGEKGALA